MFNVLRVLKDHGIGTGNGVSKKEENELTRRVAYLNGIADIYDRTVGVQDFVYDFFDATNDKSCGQIDLTWTQSMAALVTGQTEIIVRSLSYKDVNKKLHQFKVGQEITIQDTTNRERVKIVSIDNATKKLTVTPLINNYISSANIYRSNVTIANGKMTMGSFLQSTPYEQITPVNIATGSTDNNSGNKLLIDSKGVLYALFYVSSSGLVYCRKSIDNGATWVDTGLPIVSPTTGMTPAMAIDKNDNIHVVWAGIDSGSAGYYQIKYTKFNGTSWTSWVNIAFIDSNHQQYPSIAIDKNDNIHVVWHGTDASNGYGQIKYTKFNGTSWSTWVNIALITGYSQVYPAIEVDSNNNLHVVWHGTDASNGNTQIKYTKFNGTTWSTWVNISPITGRSQAQPSLVIDKDDNIHVVWYGNDNTNTSGTQIKYSKFNGTLWSAWVNVSNLGNSYAQYCPVIAADSDNNLYVVWYGLDSSNPVYHQIKYSKFDGISWGTPVNVTTGLSVHQQNPIILKNIRTFNEPTFMWAPSGGVIRFQGKWSVEKRFPLLTVDIRYNITPPDGLSDELVTWIEYENYNKPLNFDVLIEEVS